MWRLQKDVVENVPFDVCYLWKLLDERIADLCLQFSLSAATDGNYKSHKRRCGMHHDADKPLPG